jgi:hypothetical protein
MSSVLGMWESFIELQLELVVEEQKGHRKREADDRDNAC